MARKYSFDIDNLINDIKQVPWTDNVHLAKKYNISRERVRQIRLEFRLPTVEEAKEQWTIDNWDMFLTQASKGKFYGNIQFMQTLPVGKRIVEKVLKKNPLLKLSYEDTIAEREYRLKYPTEKKCLTCQNVKPINSFYKSASDRTRDGYARKCKACNISEVNRYYEIRKKKEKVIPEYKYCSSVPEVGKLPASEFYKMAGSNTGLQTQCKVFQNFFIKFRKDNNVDRARELSKVATIAYYNNFSNSSLNV